MQFTINSKANEIREKLLIITNKELQQNKIIQNKKFMINSKSLESYEKIFENYIIIEYDSFIYLNDDNEFDNKNNYPDLYQNNNFLNNNSPIKVKTKRMRLTKHPEQISCRKLSDSIEFHIKRTETKKKEMENKIKFLRNLSNELKSLKAIYPKKKIGEKIRKKKIKSNDLTFYDKTILNKENTKNDEKETNIIQLHKMWETHKKNFSKINSRNNIFKNDLFLKNDIYSTREFEILNFDLY